MPKTKQPKGGASVGGATTAPTDDIQLETNADGNDNTIHDALVEKPLTECNKTRTRHVCKARSPR